MNKKPVIGIAGTLSASPASSAFKDIQRDFTNEAYTASLVEAGALPILLPSLLSEVESLLYLCDGILLPGGFDIEPDLYGQEKGPLCQKTVRASDLFQAELLRLAYRKGIPILGICKGCQLINVHFGGTLYQDLSLCGDKGIVHAQRQKGVPFSHTVTLQEDSILSEIFGSSSLEVNSFHHQGIDRLGKGLVATALCSDGFIEGIEHKGGPWCVGVQWHPEAMMMASKGILPLFSAFVEVSRPL
ncbi:MAG TPA: gamma-glutamyl-gamma-aminobutyrate hydrolase family protein [Sphaerochaeta sp.]|nr:gamma-glutamyl-gamma-aminobutyrate hydrolase family protein [Sphaerochaeta sp.]